MKRSALFGAVLLLVCAGGCNLIDTNGVHIGYSFDPQEFKQSVGSGGAQMTLPQVACAPGQMPDPCAAAQAQLPPDSGNVSCDSGACVAELELRLPETIDLRTAQTPLPSDAIQFGVDAVAIDHIAYWGSNKLNVDTPPVDLYVAAAAAMDETDPTAVKLGSIAPIPAGSGRCGDPTDASDPAAKMGQMVCDVPLTDAGQAALAAFIKGYKTAPFKLIVRATVTAKGGDPVPQGTLDVFVRPSVTLSILK